MTVTNPTDKAITIKFKGTEYTVPASGSLKMVPEVVATHWKTYLHNFIELSADEPVKKEVVKEVKEEEKKDAPVKESKK